MAETALVTVIDGTAQHRDQVCQALTSFYRVAAFADAREAGAHLHTAEIIIVDETALPLGGRETVKRMRADGALCNKRIIGTSDIPGSSFIGRAKEYGCDAALAKPYRRSALISTISGLINHSVEDGWHSLPDNQRTALRSTLDTFNGISDLIDRAEPIAFADVRDACSPLVKAVQQDDFKVILSGVRGHDNYSYVHSLRVATFLSLLGHAMGLQGDDLLLLSSGGLLHDVGKMSIPHEVLNKPGRLDDAELKIMRSHVT
ncbi:MAG: HD domain-containing protein, partial [Rhodospirillaceae bacterium]|nr:HD domain-containing protein [Rhodospirillales bacterium]